MPVVHVNVSGMVIVESSIVVVDIHTADTTYSVTAIIDIHIADLRHTTVIIIKDRYIFDLDYGTIIVILGIGTIIVTRVEGHSVSAARNTVVDVEIKFPIRIYRKGNTVLDKNKRVVVPIRPDFRNLIIKGSCGQGTGGT